jgi:hypothetical protein
MYSPTLIEASQARLESKLSIKLHRYTRDECLSWIDHLDSLLNPETLVTIRDLRTEEIDFIKNERLLSFLDFTYWHDRYCSMSRDAIEGGGIGTSSLWESQTLLIKRIGLIQEENHRMKSEGYPTFGIKIADHKARQLGHTHLARALTLHRMTLDTGMRAMAASVDEDKKMELYDRDKLILDKLPYWMCPSIIKGTNFYDVKNEHIYFKDLGNRILYQQGNQLTGLGQGRQFEVCHLTEVASFPYPGMIENDLMPALELPSNFTLFESTAQGRGNWWHDFTESVRLGEVPGWNYHFTPWYVEKRKYREHPPLDWQPSPLTQLHAEKCRETSPLYCFGNTLSPGREQLYWYERRRARAQKAKTLSLFLANYCATSEESFQHQQEGSFTYETLEKLRLSSHPGVPYEPQIQGVVV